MSGTPARFGRGVAPSGWRAPSALGLALIALSLARPAAALDPTAPLDETLHSEWPSVAHAGSVYAMVAARAGHLWLGTSEGLVRFDGRQMLPVGGWEGPGAPRVTTLFEASDGTVWVGSDRRGAARLRGDHLEPLGLDAVPGPYVSAFAETADGSIWIAGTSGVVRLPVAGTFVRAGDGLPRGLVNALVVDRAGALWAGTQAGVSRWDGRRWQSIAGPDGRRPRVDVLRCDADGTLWAGTRGAGLWERRGDDWRVHDGREGLGGESVAALLRDRAGHLWVASRKGSLAVAEEGRFRQLAWPGACGGQIEALAEDAEGGLWIGTELCGLHRLSDRPFRALRARDGLPDDSVLGLARTPDGTVWVGSRGHGVTRLRDGVPAPVACDDARTCELCWDVSPGAAGPWLNCRDRIMRPGGAGLVGVRPLPGGWNKASFVRETADGAVWLTRNDGKVLRVAGDTITDLTEQEALEGPRLFAEGRDGVVWIAASDGIARWQRGRLELFRLPARAWPARVSSAYEDAEGTLWMGTLGAGVRRLAGGRITTIGADEGLPTGWIIQLLEDDRGRLWASSSKGIFWVARQALAEVAEHRRARVFATLYDVSDGVEMRHETFGHPAGFKDDRGRLWFATSGGIAIFDPSAPGGPAPRAMVEELRLGGRCADGQSFTGPLELTATVAALGFAPPETIAFRHRLEGRDADWIETGPDRQVSYPQLPAGKYRLLVEARGRDGTWGPSTASTLLELRPPFHQTPWFVLACAGALTAVALLAHRLRLGRVRATMQAAMAERTRIAREIHDTLAQAFVAMSVQLECIDQAVADDQPQTLRRHLDSARQVVKESLEEARRSIWVLRPQALEHGLVPAIETLVQRLSGHTVVALDVTGKPRPLPPSAEANLLRMAQEAVANAYRHAHAARIEVRLAYGAEAVTLSVRDDGTGVEPRAASSLAQGMIGLEERTAELGGRLTVDSGPGRGTMIRVEIPA